MDSLKPCLYLRKWTYVGLINVPRTCMACISTSLKLHMCSLTIAQQDNTLSYLCPSKHSFASVEAFTAQAMSQVCFLDGMRKVSTP